MAIPEFPCTFEIRARLLLADRGIESDAQFSKDIHPGDAFGPRPRPQREQIDGGCRFMRQVAKVPGQQPDSAPLMTPEV
jgi:hypothetical protein